MNKKNLAPVGANTLCQEQKNHTNNYNTATSAPKRIVALYMLLQGSMNALDAIQLYGDTCLNTTVSELYKQGYSFIKQRESHRSRSGRLAYFVRYSLAPSSVPRAQEEVQKHTTTLKA